MLAIQLEDALVNSIDLLAKSRHTNRTEIVREAIIRFLEDNEDLAMAEFAYP